MSEKAGQHLSRTVESLRTGLKTFIAGGLFFFFHAMKNNLCIITPRMSSVEISSVAIEAT